MEISRIQNKPITISRLYYEHVYNGVLVMDIGLRPSFNRSYVEKRIPEIVKDKLGRSWNPVYLPSSTFKLEESLGDTCCVALLRGPAVVDSDDWAEICVAFFLPEEGDPFVEIKSLIQHIDWIEYANGCEF